MPTRKRSQQPLELPAPPVLKMVDQYGALEAELLKLSVFPKIKEWRLLGEKIRKVAAREPVDQPVTYRGNRYSVVLSACPPKRRVIHLKQLHERLGDGFYQAADITLAALEALVPDPERADFLEEFRSGGRQIEVFPAKVAKERAA